MALSRSLLGLRRSPRRERSLVLLILSFFALLTLLALLSLPNTTNNDNKVAKVYRQLGEHAMLLLPPPTQLPGQERWEEERRRLFRKIDNNNEDNNNVLIRPGINKSKGMSGSSSSTVVNPNSKGIDKPRVISDRESMYHDKDSNDHDDDENDEPHNDDANDMQRANDDNTHDDDEEHNTLDEDSDKADFVKKMMKHAWDGYATYAWGSNELRPISLRPHSGSIFGNVATGATIIDAMDTLYLMGMKEELEQGRQWIQDSLEFKAGGDISVFETNIRYVGGLLSLYAFTGDSLYKNKSAHIAQKLLPAFNTPTGIPKSLINMRTGASKSFGWASGGCSILSEFGTLHMEFTYLSDITGDPVYADKVDRIRQVLASLDRPDGLYPNYLNSKSGKWCQQHVSMGALGDSFYEYLIKEYQRSGFKDVQAKSMYDDAVAAVERELLKTSPNDGLLYFAEKKYGRFEHKMDHLACFAGGMFALGAYLEGKTSKNYQRWMDIGEGIAETCHESYIRSATGLGPESFRFNNAREEAKASKATERYYILRPETFETYFVMWRLTKKQKYRDWGWEAVQALEKHCRVEGGYTGIKNVYSVDSVKDDVMQSFFLAETLKYLYLLFSDDSVLSLDDWVFNSEAHPLPVRGSSSYRAHDSKLDKKSKKHRNKTP